MKKLLAFIRRVFKRADNAPGWRNRPKRDPYAPLDDDHMSPQQRWLFGKDYPDNNDQQKDKGNGDRSV